MGKNIDSESQASWIGQEVSWWRMEYSAKKSLPASFLFGQGFKDTTGYLPELLGVWGRGPKSQVVFGYLGLGAWKD